MKDNITARLAAAFNRSTLLVDDNTPDGENPSNYYQNPVTNHYARLVHAANLDGRGYAFPYDDVAPSNGADQSGSVFDPNEDISLRKDSGTRQSIVDFIIEWVRDLLNVGPSPEQRVLAMLTIC